MADNIVGNLVVKLTFDSAEFEKGITSAKRELNSYGKATQTSINAAKESNYAMGQSTTALNNMKVTYQAMSGVVSQMTSRQKALAEAGKTGTVEYKKLSREISQYKDKMYSLGLQYDQIQKKAYIQNSAFTKFGNTLGTVSRGMSQAGQWFDNVGSGLTRVGIMASAAGSLFIKQAVDYEKGMIQVQKTTNASDEEIAKFSEQIKGLARTMPVGIGELQNLAAIAGQLGIKQSDLATFTETMAKLGTATSLSSAEASEAIARFTNVSGTGTETINNLGSALVALGNNLATSETEIMDMAGLLVGTLTTLGASEADILGIAGAMSSLGITAERGGSSISKFFVELATAVADGGADLEAFAQIADMSSESFANLFRQDSVSAFTSFIDGLARIKAEGGDVVKTLDDLGIKEIRLRDTILKLVNGNDLLHQSLELSNAEFEKGTALNDEYNQQLKSTAAQWEITKNKLQLVAIAIGDALLPVVNDLLSNSDGLISMAQDFAEWFANLDDGVKKFIVTAGGLSLVLGPIMSGIGTFMQLGSGVVGSISAITKGLGFLDGVAKALKAGNIAGEVSKWSGAFSLLNPTVLTVAGSLAIAYGAYKILTDEALLASKAMKEFPDITDITLEQAESLRSVKDDIHNLNVEMGNLGTGSDMSGISGSLQTLGDEILRLNNEKIAKLKENFEQLPAAVQKALEGSLEATIQNIEDQSTRVEEIQTRLQEINEKTIENSGVIPEHYLKEVNGLTQEMMGHYAMSLGETVDQANEIYKVLTMKHSEMNSNQLEDRRSYLFESLQNEREAHDQNIKNLKQYYKDNEFTVQAANQGLENLEKAHKSQILAIQTDMIHTGKEMFERYGEEFGVTYNEMIDSLVQETGLTRQQVEAIWNSEPMYFGDLELGAIEAMNKVNAIFNDLEINPGEINTENIDAFISRAMEAGITWEELELLSKDANIDDNTRAFIIAAMESSSVWKFLTFDEKVAKINAEGASALKGMMESTSLWNDLTVEDKEAIIETIEKGESLSSKLLGMEQWNQLTLSEKLAIVATEGHESMESLLEEYRVFDYLPPEITKEAVLEAIANGTLDVESFINTWQGTEFQTKMAEIQATADPGNAVATFIAYWLANVLLGNLNKTAEINAEDNASQIVGDATSKVNEYGKLAPNVALKATDDASGVVAGAQGAVDKLGRTHPNSRLSATDSASGTINSVRNNLYSLDGRTANTYVYTHYRTTGRVARFAKGTQKHLGGLAILGDGGKREPFLTPQGGFGISPKTDTLYNLPYGTKVWPSIQKFKSEAQNNSYLARLIDKLPHFASGTPNSFLDGMNTMKLPFESKRMNMGQAGGDTYNFEVNLQVIGSSLSRSQADNIIEPLMESAKRYGKKHNLNLNLGGA